MTLSRLILHEIRFRALSFLLGALSVVVAVGCLVGALVVLKKHDLRTEQVIATKQQETQDRLDKMEDDVRKITLGMGFNVLILPKDQNLGDLYADDFASKYMPEEYATRLAKSRVATINHILPSLQQKIKWPEQERTVILMGVRGEVYMQGPKQKPLLHPIAPGTVMLGHELARNLKLAVGDAITLKGQKFTIASINPERGNKDDITIWMDLPAVQELLDQRGKINAILALDCTCSTIDRLALIRAEISKILPDTQIIEFQSQALARAEARQRAAAEAREAIAHEREARDKLRQEREALAAILVPVVGVGACVWIGLLALANVRERRGEIAILRALGLRSGQLLMIFLGKALLIGIVGAVLGYLVGIGLGQFWKETNGDGALHIGWWQPAWFTWVLVGAPLLSALASWLPALAAAQEDPATILSQE